ncbi:DUF2716 domain-containing protein [Embleya sp. NPDC059237]|uniref:DUF2716 domain-containing protein n=1 Tax=Embleya sp. NPDC059237 TaxID=3346784 RepID=UPI00367F13BD
MALLHVLTEDRQRPDFTLEQARQDIRLLLREHVVDLPLHPDDVLWAAEHDRWTPAKPWAIWYRTTAHGRTAPARPTARRPRGPRRPDHPRRRRGTRPVHAIDAVTETTLTTCAQALEARLAGLDGIGELPPTANPHAWRDQTKTMLTRLLTDQADIRGRDGGLVAGGAESSGRIDDLKAFERSLVGRARRPARRPRRPEPRPFGRVQDGLADRCAPGEFLWLLDWQHTCHRLRPDVPETDMFLPRVLEGRSREGRSFGPYPDGDHHVFLAQDLRFGTFGHPWEHTLCVFGAELLNTIEQDMHHILGRPLRRDGAPVD